MLIPTPFVVGTRVYGKFRGQLFSGKVELIYTQNDAHGRPVKRYVVRVDEPVYLPLDHVRRSVVEVAEDSNATIQSNNYIRHE